MSHHVPADAIHQTPSEAAPGFAARLREETKLVHREAERSGFIADLIRGRATPAGYALFLRNLVPVYAALEAGLDAAPATPLLAAFREPALRRLPRLNADIAAIDSDGGRGPLPEARAYADAIIAARADPPRLVAHAYARYLGDLSGGQILKPILARTLGLEPGQLTFYDFPDIADAEAAKAAMRAALDTLAPVGAEADAVCAEAIAAFRHNIALALAIGRALEPVA